MLYSTLRDVGHLLSSLESGLLMTAVALANWHARHRFSPASGGPAVAASAGAVRRAGPQTSAIVSSRTDADTGLIRKLSSFTVSAGRRNRCSRRGRR